MKYQVPGPGSDCSASKGPVNPYQAHRVPAATVTTTVAVAYTANIGVTRRPRWSHRSRSTTKIHQATPSFPRPAGWGRVPTGPSSGAPRPYPRRESRVVQPNELLLKGSVIKAVFSLALLPRRPYMRESSCSVGGGVDSSNHQFPRQTFPIRLQVRLRVGRLTLGLTVADRWECSQATGLPAWHHQDLHITANRAHGITGTLTEESVLRYWSRMDLM